MGILLIEVNGSIKSGEKTVHCVVVVVVEVMVDAMLRRKLESF